MNFDFFTISNFFVFFIYKNYTSSQVLSIEPLSEEPISIELLRHLRKTMREIASPDFFPNYYALLDEVAESQNKKITRANAVDSIKNKAGLAALVDSFLVMNDLPTQIIEARKRSGELFQYIDDYDDIDADLEDGAITVVNQSSCPEETLRTKLDEVKRFYFANVPNPEFYMSTLGKTAELAIALRNEAGRLHDDLQC
jgi:hypothetical protein